jgi:hypothetical protein
LLVLRGIRQLHCFPLLGRAVIANMKVLVVLVFALLLTPSLAWAQPGPAAPQDLTASWQADFDAANGLLLRSEFAAAASAFSNLAKLARSPIEAALAREMSALAQRWQRDGVNATTGLVSDRRSSGEMASLYTSSVFYGVGSGIALVVYTEPDSAAGVILPSLVLGGLTAAGMYALDKKHTMRAGVPQSIIAGMTIGLTEGIAWTYWNQASVDEADEWESTTIVTVIWGSATVGAITGGLIGQRLGTSPGRASMLGSASLWSGTVAGMLTAGVLGDDDETDDYAMLAAALGLTGGAVGGYFLGEAQNPSVARVRYIDLGGIAGGLVAGGLYISAANEDTDGTAALLTTGTGIAAGLGVAYYLTRNMKQGESLSGAPQASWMPTILPVEGGALAGLQGPL